MGRKPTLSEEAEALRAVTREAHEATQALRDAIKEALALAPALTAEFEDHHAREMKILDNHFANQSNLVAKRLNEAVTEARQEIIRQISISKLVLDPEERTMRVSWSGTRFDDQQPRPYPTIPAPEDYP